MASADIAIVQEEKKSQDSASVNEDVESSHWSDDPEKAHFREMMDGKEGEDSVLGNNTVDQILAGRERTLTEDSQSYMTGDPNAPLRLAVLGPEDDLSTLAGDTITGSVVTEGAVFSNANLPYAITTKPRQRDFREYEAKDLQTPPKKKRWHPYMGRDDTDDDTQPETPPAVVGMGNNKDEMESQDKDGDTSTYFSYVSPSKKIYICAAVIGFILLLMIIGLAVAYSQLSDDGNDGSTSTSAQATSNEDFTMDNLPPIAPAPVASPVDFPADPPSDVGVVEDSTAPQPAPVVVPTRPPVPINVDSEAALLATLASSGVDTTIFINDLESPQYRALAWLAADPNFDVYTERRLVQRWTLAVLAKGLYTDEAQVNSAGDVLANWLEYDINECDWFTTRSDFICNGFGYYEYLALENQNLHGTLPTELGLLESLVFLNLAGNQLTGTIPSEIGNLFNLKRLRVVINNLQGTLPTELGRLTQLDVLGAGRNQLTGTIPTEIGLMAELNTLGLEDNLFSGPIPAEIGDAQKMLFVALNKNQLTGNVPREFGNLASLQSLDVGRNNLTGEVPWQICELGTLTIFEADCQMVACSCCSSCSATPSPTAAPFTPSPTQLATNAPTEGVTTSPTISPTRLPTLTPTTAAPTTCFGFIEWVPDCIDVGEELEVRFQNCDPQFGDWIGIFLKDADPTNLPAPFLWVWACGSQSCRGSPQTNTVTLGEDDVDSQVAQSGNGWPLEKGDYHAYLIRNAGPPYVAELQSEKMKIRENTC